jgi:hypothetical protein
MDDGMDGVDTEAEVLALRSGETPSEGRYAPLVGVRFLADPAVEVAMLVDLWNAPDRWSGPRRSLPAEWAAVFAESDVACKVWDGSVCRMRRAGDGWWDVAVQSGLWMAAGPVGGVLLTRLGVSEREARALAQAGYAVAPEQSVGFRLDDRARRTVADLFAASGWLFLVPRAGDGKGPGVLAVPELVCVEGVGG